MKLGKRLLAFVLAWCMLFSAVPTQAFAAAEDRGSIVNTEPAETQPKETKPKETQPKETESKETKSKETQPKETQPKETKPKETQPKVTEPKETKPKETEPKETKPKETEPKETEPKETEPKETEPKETKPKETEPKETEPKETEPKETEPKETEPKETEPKETEPKETEPKETEPKETEPKETEPKETEPKETEPKETEPKETEPKETEPKETEPEETEPEAEEVSGYFSIKWSNSSHSGRVPNVAADVRILDADGNRVDATVTKSGSGYTVYGLMSNGTYTVELAPGKDSTYSVTGDASAKLVYDSEEEQFAAKAFNAALDTYTLLYNVEWPEGVEAPEGFDVALQLGETTLDLQETAAEDGYVFGELYEVDGDYTLILPEVEGLTASRYAVPFNSKTQQPLVLAYDFDELTAEFVIYWSDRSDRLGYRTLQTMEQMLTVSASGKDLDGISIDGVKQEKSELAGYEKYLYTVTGLPSGLGDSVKLRWSSDALLCYRSLGNTGKVKAVADFSPMTLSRDGAVFTSEKAYIMSLPEYKVTVSVVGLGADNEEGLRQFMDGIRIQQLDAVEGTETPYTGFWLSYSDGAVTIEGLTADVLYNDMGEWIAVPGCYIVTWPQEIGSLDLQEESDAELFVGRSLVQTFASTRGDSLSFSARADYGAPSFTASTAGTETENKTILWYDTTNNYNHGGQLTLETSVTINGEEYDITLTPADWNAAQGKYVYSFSSWSVETFCTTFGIERYPDNLNPIDRDVEDTRPTSAEVQTWLNELTLEVKDNGGNELNRTMVASIDANLNVARDQFAETDATWINYPVTIGEIEATAVDYTPATATEEIRDYMIGSAVIDGVQTTVLYPLAHVQFTIDVLTGDDDLKNLNTPQSEFAQLAAFGHMQIKENNNIIDMVLAPDATGESYLENRLNLIDDLGNSFVSGTFDTVTDRGVYTFLLPLYNENKVQIEYAMSFLDEDTLAADDKKLDLGNDEYYFRVEYNNTSAPGHGTDLDRAYQGGRTILIRTGETSFTFNKYWVDGYSENLTDEQKAAILQGRPQATYELWRYPDKTNPETGITADYSSSANVTLPRQVTGVIPTFDPDASDPNKYTITFPKDCLEKYDGEGYPYIYFIRETIPGNSGYEKFYGKVDADGNVTDDVLDVPYAEGAERETGDHSVYNNGNISNVKTDRISTSATKTWVGAYYQDRFDEVKVTMKLYRKLEGTADSTAELHETHVMDGFNAYNLTQTVGGSYDLYDENGRKYVYWWEEADVVQVDSNGNAITVTNVPAGLSGIQSGTAINAKVGTTKTYYLPMNAATMESDSYSPTSQEYFEVTSYVDAEGITHFTNTLKGDTEYWIRKTWDTTLTPTDVNFPLLQINSNGVSSAWSQVFTLETEDYLINDRDSGWHKGYVNLPKYDEDGNLYTYIAREGSIDGVLPITSYGHDVNGADEPTDGDVEAQSVQIHNAPVGRVAINLRKIWLDDSANTDRTDVQLQVTITVERTDANGNKVQENVTMYGPNGLYGGYVNLDKSTDWIQTKDVTIYRVDGEYVTHLPANVTGNAPNLPAVIDGEEGGNNGDGDGNDNDDSTTETTPVVENITIVSINVTEVSLGEDGEATVDTQNTTPAGYPTVQYGDTTYAVFYNGANGMNPTATTKMDEDEYYTVTNLRIGTTQLGVTKIWNDDGEVIREDYQAKIKVTSKTADRLKSENSLGYAKVHPAVVASGWTPVNGGTADTPTAADKTHVDLIQALPTGQDSRGTSFTSFIYYYDLPLYDETGKILEYSVEELPGLTDANGGHYSMVSTPLEYGNNSTASQYFGMQTVTNTFTNEAPVEFYLLWLDDYRESINLRPDMFLTLYYAEYEYDADGNLILDDATGEPRYTVKRYDYHEYSWNDATRLSESFWKYTFNGLPQYDEHGRKISYYATVSSHVEMGKIDYLAPQYALDYVDANSIFQSSGVNQSTVNSETLAVTHTVGGVNSDVRQAENNAVVLRSENTFVLQLRSNVIVQGRKVWEQIPEGFPVSDLPLLTFLLKRQLTAEEMKPEHLSIFSADTNGRITLSAIIDYRSPSQDYTFDMNYMGLLTQNDDGSFSVIPANTVIGDTTALAVWMELAGIAAADAEKAAAFYGQPLPKYDSYGTMYSYQVIESLVRPNNEGFMADNNLGVEIVLQTSLNEYKLINTINLGKRPITVSKNWFRFDDEHAFVDTTNAVYPPMEFQLYRFVRIDNENFEDSLTNPGDENDPDTPEYTDPLLVKTVTLTSAEVKAIVSGDQNIYAAFGDMEVYAPNGNPYIYVVAEKKINGFNTQENPNITVSNAVQVPQGETGVANWPEFTGDYWYSTPFKLTASEAGAANPVDTAAAAGTVFDNVYTAMQQTNVPFTKIWNDFSNQFTTRPATVSVILSRSFTAAGKTRTEEIATITVNGTTGATTVEWRAGFRPTDPLESATNIPDDAVVYKNLTSAYPGKQRIEVTNGDLTTTNQWKFTVNNLDKHAPNGSEYRYTWKEATVPEGYVSSVVNGGLKNSLSVSLRVFKEWHAVSGETLNSQLAYPSVTVGLMVSDDEGATWDEAWQYDGGVIAQVLGEDYEFVRELEYPYWYTYYENLPTGNDQKSLTYKVVEIKAGTADMVQPNPGWTVTYTGSENTFTVNNILDTTDFTVTKVWDDDDNVFGTRYLNAAGKWEVSFQLYRSTDNTLNPAGDEKVMVRVDADTVEELVLTVTGSDAVSKTASSDKVTGLPTHSPDGKAYTYYAVELNPDRDNNTSVGDPVSGNLYDGTYSVTNSYTGNSNDGFTTTVTNDMNSVNLEVTKVWLNDVGYAGVRPGAADAATFPWDTLDLTLMQYTEGSTEGEPITNAYINSEGGKSADFHWNVVTDNNNQWRIIFTGLPKSDPDGKDYTYKVTEAKVQGYQPGTYENGTPVTSGNQSYQVNNDITKFRIEKIGKNNESAAEGDILRDVTLEFRGVEDHNRNFTLTWTSETVGNSYRESYTVKDPSGNVWSEGSATGAKVDIYGLPEGKYQITGEPIVPDGYYAAVMDTARYFTLQTDADGNQELVETSAKTDVDASGGLPELEVYNYKTSLKINKLGRTMNSGGTLQTSTSNIASGWKFEITGVFADSVDTNNDGVKDPETRYYTADNAKNTDLWLGDLIVDTNYTMKEVEHPAGYILKETTVTFKINRVTNKVELVGTPSSNLATTNDNGELNFKDDPFKFTVTKKSTESGNANLNGAQYKLYVLDEVAKTMTEVTSQDALTTSSGKFTVRSYRTNPKLMADNTTKYFLVETKAPDGYVLEDVAGPAGYTLPSAIKTDGGLTHPWIIFHFTKAGVMVQDSKCTITERASSASVNTASNNTVAFTDDPTELYLHKHDNGDVFTHGPLDVDGITFQLKNSSGTVLGTVTTGTNGHIDFANLKNASGNRVRLVGGQTYTLSEVKDAGYKQFPDVTFKVETNGKISNITYAAGADFVPSTPTDGRENSFFEIGNTREPGTMTLTKTSDFGLLDEVVFELYHKDPADNLWDMLKELLTGKTYRLAWTETGTAITGYDIVASESVPGKLILKNLPWGEYKLVEKTTKDGFVVSTEEIPFTIGRPTTNVHITKEDTLQNEDFSVVIDKLRATGSDASVSIGTSPLKDAEFQLYAKENGASAFTPVLDSEGNARTYKSNSAGKVTVNSIDGTTDPYTVVMKTSKDAASANWYRLVEIKATDGYILPDNAPAVDFWVDTYGNITYSDNSNYVSGNDVGNLPIKLTLTKFDLGDEYIDPHKYTAGTVKFTIVEKNTNRSGNLTMTDGVMHIGIDYGYYLVGGNSYTVTETQILENGKPITGYETLNSFTFKVETNGTISGLTFVDANGNPVSNSDTYGDVKDVASDATAMELYNQRKRGTVELLKKDADLNNYPLNDAEFELRRDSDPDKNWLKALADFITGNTYELVWSTAEGSTSVTSKLVSAPDDGKLVISNLPWGTYYLVETKAPAGYELPADESQRTYEFTIDQNNVSATVVMNPVLNEAAEFDFYKHAMVNSTTAGDAKEGAEFKLHLKGSETAIKTYTSDASGKITVRSTGLVNEQLVVYIQTSANYSEAVAEGRVYRVTETKAPAGYELQDTPAFAEFWVDKQGNFHVVDKLDVVSNNKFLDKPIELTLTKMDGGDKFADPDTYTGEVKFLIKKQGDATATEVTMTNGVLKLGVEHGFTFIGGQVYELTEQDVTGYETVDSFTFKVEEDGTISNLVKTTEHGAIAENGTTGIQITNERIPGSVMLTKMDMDLTYALDDAEFELRRKNEANTFVQWFQQLLTGNAYEVIWTNNTASIGNDADVTALDGQLIIGNLPWGDYQLVETKAPDGYKLPADPDDRIHPFSIGASNCEAVVNLSYVDNDSFVFNFFKHASADGTNADDPLPGAAFKLHRKGEETALQTYTSDANGMITVKSAEKIGSRLVTYMKVSASEAEAKSNGAVYRITETKAPAGYELTDTAPYVEFWIDSVGGIQILEQYGTASDNQFLDKPIELTLTKMDGGDKFADPDTYRGEVKFLIKKQGDATGTEVTMTNGILLLGVEHGFTVIGGQVYELTEQDVTGYETVDTFTFKVEENGTISNLVKTTEHGAITENGTTGIQVTNERIPGSIKLTKVNSTLDVDLNNAEFELRRKNEANTFVQWFQQLLTGNAYEVIWTNNTASIGNDADVTALDGELIISNLPWGDYQLVETKAPNGFELPEDPDDRVHNFTINASNTESVVTLDYDVENDTFQFTFYKHASADGVTASGSALQGAEFKLHLHDSDADIKTYTSDMSGAFTVKSAEKVGSALAVYMKVSASEAEARSNDALYRVTETKAPIGYELPSPAPFVEFWVNETGAIQITDSHALTDNSKFADKAIELTLTKFDDGDQFDAAHKYVAGTVLFTIEEVGSDAEPVEIPMVNGVITFSNKPGHYMVESGKTYRITETQVTGYEELDSFTFTVDADGTIIDLTTETEHGSIELDGTEGIKVSNQRIPGSVKLTKWDNDLKVNLDGAEFELHRETKPDTFAAWLQQLLTGNTYQVVWTTSNGKDVASVSATEGEDGELIISNLPWGDYKLVETKAPAGYMLPEDLEDREHPFTINASNASETVPVDLKYVDNDSFYFEFFKYASENLSAAGDPLEGAEFKLHLKGSETAIKTYTTDGNGKITVYSAEKVDGELETYMQVSTSHEDAVKYNRVYRITETKAPDGYELPDTAPYVEFWVDATGHFRYVAGSGVREQNKFLDKPIELTIEKWDGGDEFDNYDGEKIYTADTVYFTITEKETGRTDELTMTDGTLHFGPGTENDFMVIGGMSYELTETKVTGYGELRTIEFTVSLDGEVENVKFAAGTSTEIYGEVAVNGTEGIKITNERIPGSVKLTKVDKDLAVTLDGAEFTLERKVGLNYTEWITGFVTGNAYEITWNGNTAAKTIDTDETVTEGQLLISELPWGEYRLVETKAPNGYKLPETGKRYHTFTINASTAETVQLNAEVENDGFEAYFFKHASANGTTADETLLAGAEFELRLAGSTDVIETYVSDGDGKITLKSVEKSGDALTVYLKVSTSVEDARANGALYQLVETKAPLGYELPDEAPYVEFWFNETGVIQYTANKLHVAQNNKFLDKPIELTLNKRDGGDEYAAEDFLGDVTFNILDSEGNSLGVTATVITEDSFAVQLAPVYVTVEGKPVCVFPVGGETYTLRESDVNGYHGMNDISFTVEENGTLSNVHFVGTAEHGTAVIGNTAATELKVINDRIYGSVTLRKYTVFGNEEFNLNNAHFQLSRADDAEGWLEKLMQFITGKTYTLVWSTDETGTSVESQIVAEPMDGNLVISNLPWGDYVLTETKSPDGFILENQTYPFSIGPDDTEAEVLIDQSGEILNNSFTFSFYKHASTDGTTAGEALAGAEFKLEVNTGDGWAEVETDQSLVSTADGITLNSIEIVTETVEGEEVNSLRTVLATSPNGTEYIYRLTEMKAPDGYELPDTKPTVQFWFDTNGDAHIVENSAVDVTDAFEFLDKPIEITLEKWDGGDAFDNYNGKEIYTAAEVYFTITEEGTGRTDVLTMTDGTLRFGPGTENAFMLIGGKTYTLVETKVEGYRELLTMTFHVDENGTVDTISFTGDGESYGLFEADGTEGLRVTNERVPGTVKLTKYTTISQDYDLNDAEFELRREVQPENFQQWLEGFLTGNAYEIVWTNGEDTDELIGSAAIDADVTAADGELIISNLPWGKYQLVETKAPDGYVLPADETLRTFGFTIDAASAEETVVIEPVFNSRFCFSFSKNATTDGTDLGAALEGAEFALEYLDENGAWQTLETNQSLTTNADGFILLESVEEVTVADPNGESADATKLALRTVFVTGASVDTAPHYRLVETKAPAGYILPDNAPTVEFWFDLTGALHIIEDSLVDVVTEAGDHNFAFLDKLIELQLNKRDGGDEYDDENPMAGVLFEILNSNGESFETPTFVTTGEDGKVDLPHIFETNEDGKSVCVFPVGGETYFLRETTVNGFKAVNDISFKVEENGTVSNVVFVESTEEDAVINGSAMVGDVATEVKVINDRIYGSVTLSKLTDFEDMLFDLNDAEFELSREDDTEGWLDQLLGFITGKTYTLVWSTTEGNTSVESQIVSEPGDGKLVISNLPWGTYVLTETKAPDGFVLEGQTFTFTIGPDNLEENILMDASGEVTNNSFEFQFSKHATLDGTTAGDGLAGAEFLLEVNTGNGWTPVVTSQSLISGADGTVKLTSIETVEVAAEPTSEDGDDGIEDDKGAESAPQLSLRTVLATSPNGTEFLYRLTETKAPAGYELPDTAPYVEFWFDTDGVAHITDSLDVTNAFEFLDKPIELKLFKYDGGDRCTEVKYTFDASAAFEAFDKLALLSGIEFTLTDSEGNTQTATTADGVLTFGPGADDDFFVIGGQTYTLTESDTESIGYTEVIPFTFTVNENGTITLPESTPAAVTKDAESTALRVVNDRILGTVKLLKTTDAEAPLDGVVFNLYREDVPATLLEQLMNFITGKTYSLTASFAWGEDATDAIAITEGTEKGVLYITGLDWGSYKLVETVADGYILPTDEAERTYTFEIGPENTETEITLNAELNVINTPNRLVVRKVEDGKDEALTGAEYELYRVEEDGKLTKITNTTDPMESMWIWDSLTGTGEASCLLIGTYRLVETKSPYGYVVAKPITFTIDQYGKVTILEGNGRLSVVSEDDKTPMLLAEDLLTEFSFTKVELYNESCYEYADETRILPGVTFTAYSTAKCREADIIATAVSDANGIVTFKGLPLKDYRGEGTSTPVYIRETATVEGHVLDKTVYMVYVDSVIGEDGEIVTKAVLLEDGFAVENNTVINDVHRGDFTFTKVSELDNAQIIPGAKYGLYKTVYANVAGIQVPHELLVATAISDEDGVVTFNGLLMDTEYTVRELSVPVGCYLSANSISFKLTWTDGHSVVKILDDGDGTITESDDGLLWQEPQVVVSILKTNSRGKPLAGAVLQLRDSDGNIIPVLDKNGKEVNSWVSTKEAFIVAGLLEAGETYWLYELKAPTDYVKGKRVKFTIPEDPVEPGEELVIKVRMKNYHKSELPKTGEDTALFVGLGAMFTSGAALISMLLFGKNKRRLAWLLAKNRSNDEDDA